MFLLETFIYNKIKKKIDLNNINIFNKMNLNNDLDEEWMNFNENGNFESNKKSIDTELKII